MSNRRTTLIAAILLPVAALISLFAVSAADAGTAHQATHQVHAQIQTPTITISMFAYHTPASVAHGALVKVINKDSVAHTVTSNTAGKFNVRVPAHSSRTFHAPATKGAYGFHCTIHPSMKGTLHVS